MSDFADIESFYKQLRYQVEHSMKNELLPQIKETAQDILIREIYSKFTPKIYKRLNELTDSLMIECKWISDTEYQGILRVSTDKHPTSNWDAWEGNVDHTFDEIINEFFVNGRSYSEDKLRAEDQDLSVDVLGTTQKEMIDTGQAIQILYNELRKKFDIV